MKKLKKVLSLVLVLAMALSMFGVCASATDVKDYPDYDEITYTEAVGVLSGIGVLQGDEGGFRPTEGLTRAEAAKIADYLIGLQDNNVAEGTKFNDIKGHWAEEYITIAESVGLVNGNGDGTFDPEGDLTGYAWEKMVLCALGYNAEYEGMLGDNWEGGVAILAKKVDLLAGLDASYDATKAITREEAAQIAYNALKTETVTYKINGTTHTNAKGTGELLGAIYNLAEKNTFDVYGAPTAHVFYNAKTNAEYVSFPIAADDSYGNVRGGVKVDDIAKTLPKGTDIAVYVDGEKVNDAVVGGRGVQVGVYTLVDGTVRVVEINTYVGLADDIVTEGKNVKASYMVNGFKFDGVAEWDEVVVYTVGNKAPEAPYTATAYRQNNTAVLGTITAVSGNYGSYTDGMYVGIDGTKTYFNVNCLPSGRPMVNAVVGAYYDVYGNILYLDMEPVLETISEMQRIYILDASIYVEGSSTVDKDDITNSTYTSDLILQAHAIVWDDNAASIETINIAVVEENGKYMLLDEYGYAMRRGITLPGTELLIETLLKHAQTPGGTISISGITFPVVGTTVTAQIGQFAEAYVTEDGEYVIGYIGSQAVQINDRAATVTADGTTYAADDNIKATYLTYNEQTGEVAVEVTNGYRALKPAGMGQFGVQGVVVAPVENKEKATEVVVLQYPGYTHDIYGIYLGVLEDNTNGRAYAFGLSDGSIAVLNYKGATPPDNIMFDILSLFVDTTDYAKIFGKLEATNRGTVCTITLNNATGLIEDVAELEAAASGYVEDIKESRIFLGKKDAVNYSKAYDFARDFGKQGYKTEFDWTAADYTGAYAKYEDNDFVYLYTVRGEVVFITVGHISGEPEYAINEKGEVIETICADDIARVDGMNGEVLSEKKVADAKLVKLYDANDDKVIEKYVDPEGRADERVIKEDQFTDADWSYNKANQASQIPNWILCDEGEDACTFYEAKETAKSGIYELTGVTSTDFPNAADEHTTITFIGHKDCSKGHSVAIIYTVTKN